MKTIDGVEYFVIASLENEAELAKIKIAEPLMLTNASAWLADGTGLVYVKADKEGQNSHLWLQTLDSSSPRKLANIDRPDGFSLVRGLVASPDGQTFAISQGDWKHDAILLRGLK